MDVEQLGNAVKPDYFAAHVSATPVDSQDNTPYHPARSSPESGYIEISDSEADMEDNRSIPSHMIPKPTNSDSKSFFDLPDTDHSELEKIRNR